MKRTVLIVTFNSATTLRRTLNAIQNEAVMVVDNASSDRSIDVAAEFDNVQVVQTGRNGGFSFAVNRGLERITDGDVVILNPDVLCSSKHLDELATTASLEGVGIVGPRLVYPDGRSQGNGRQFPNLPELIRRRIGHHLGGQPNGGRQFVDWLMGALLYVPRHTLEIVGPLDEKYRLYCEDVDYCSRVWRAGLSVVLDNEITTQHLYQRASHGLWRLSDPPVRWHWASMLRLAHKYPRYFAGLESPRPKTS